MWSKLKSLFSSSESDYPERIRQAYGKILYREPDAPGLSELMDIMRLAPLSQAEIEERLRNCAEYRDGIEPLRRAIEKDFECFHLRAPKEQEFRHHIIHFLEQFDGTDEATRMIRKGDFHRHLDIRPINAELDITNACNLRCVMCYFSHPIVYERNRKDMPFEHYEKIASELFTGVHRLSLSLSAEPLLHPQCCEMVALAKSYRIPTVYLATNGMLLTERISEHLVGAGLDAINLSIDAATPPTFERLRKGGRFERVIQNIKILKKMRDGQGSRKPLITLSFVLMQSNISELPEFIHLARSLEVDDIHLMHMVPYEGLDNYGESLVHEKKKCNDALNEARRLARDFEMHLKDPGDFAIPERDGAVRADPVEGACKMDNLALKRFNLNLTEEDAQRGCCPFPWHFVGIEPCGYVQPCGWWYEGERMGNINSQSFNEIWSGPSITGLRESLVKGTAPMNCRQCPAAGMGRVSDPSSFAVQCPFIGRNHRTEEKGAGDRGTLSKTSLDTEPPGPG
ncbi:MAG: radical SAM protein [Planctomycetota bacterium]|jgi:radical SAM protein with 4Fe4S-binding SPASM domain